MAIIDVGTSNSAAGVLRGGKPVIIPNLEGMNLGAARIAGIEVARGKRVNA